MGIDFGSPDVQAAIWTVLIGSISNAACAILGCYLVLRRMSLLGDAISHAVLPGIVVAFLLSGKTAILPVFLGAAAVGLLTAFLTQVLCNTGRVPEDASMGVVFTSLFALGVILVSKFAANVHIDADCVLYGDILLATLETQPILGIEAPRILVPVVSAFLATVLFVVLLWKELKIVSFDPQLATTMGLKAGLVHYLLMAMVAGVTVASFEAVGSILVIAMLIVPAATAHLLCDRLSHMVLIAAGVGVLSSALGYWWAVALNTSVAGMMAVVAGLHLVVAVFLAPKHGVLSRLFNALALSIRIAGEDVLASLYRREETAGAATPVPLADCLRLVGDDWRMRLAIYRLRSSGDLAVHSGSIHLTGQGRQHARSLVRAHRLWESYMVEHFDLPLDHLHEPASRIEHFLGPQLQEELAAELDTAVRDPHGRPIPPRTP